MCTWFEVMSLIFESLLLLNFLPGVPERGEPDVAVAVEVMMSLGDTAPLELERVFGPGVDGLEFDGTAGGTSFSCIIGNLGTTTPARDGARVTSLSIVAKKFSMSESSLLRKLEGDAKFDSALVGDLDLPDLRLEDFLEDFLGSGSEIFV